jgi:uncharacterized protein YbjT (DUF2867 family)
LHLLIVFKNLAMQQLTALVLGATGLIGEQLVKQLLADAAFSKVRILVRRPVDLSNPKLEVEIVDFSNLADYRKKIGTGDCIFCCIGTTQSKVKGDRNEYRRVDFDIPVNAAVMGKDAGFTSYLLVSAVGANSSASNFYLKLKGEVEEKIASVEYQAFHAFRPSILFGKRTEFRFGELIGKGLMKAISVLFVGGAAKYKGIEGAVVARSMIAAAKLTTKGMFIHHYKDMMKLAGKLWN